MGVRPGLTARELARGRSEEVLFPETMRFVLKKAPPGKRFWNGYRVQKWWFGRLIIQEHFERIDDARARFDELVREQALLLADEALAA